MRNLYLTHKPSELAMAAVQVECFAFCIWMIFIFDDWFARWVFAHFAATTAVLAYQFLFCMSGSRLRRTPTETEVGHG